MLVNKGRKQSLGGGVEGVSWQKLQDRFVEPNPEREQCIVNSEPEKCQPPAAVGDANAAMTRQESAFSEFSAISFEPVANPESAFEFRVISPSSGGEEVLCVPENDPPASPCLEGQSLPEVADGVTHVQEIEGTSSFAGGPVFEKETPSEQSLGEQRSSPCLGLLGPRRTASASSSFSAEPLRLVRKSGSHGRRSSQLSLSLSLKDTPRSMASLGAESPQDSQHVGMPPRSPVQAMK
ncbi:unnamed protein product [Ostreobium quekettii]|uniref:Uncharacterized protein n=1 Tax=Ostreobium quekettii TaxID=121088 RepID=A0A8S1JIR5_9CHLO|nr:unnamed protein product [Ostreobium quekettii]